MYSREVKPAPENLIQDGKPVFGTFNSLPKKLNIKGITTPYSGIPLPPALSRLKIRARAVYTFSLSDYIGTVDFFDGKTFNMAEFSFWNWTRGTKYVYRTFLGVRKKLVPTKLEHAQCLSPSPARYIRLSWNHPADRLSLKINVFGLKHRPEIELALSGRFNDSLGNEIVSVKPAPTMRRCSASYFASTKVSGHFKMSGVENRSLESADGAGLLFVNRAYYKFITFGESICAVGRIAQKQITLRLSTTNLDAVNTEKYNDNVLFTEGHFTPLPPVRITHPFGIQKNWTIQDYESMVDLEFTPQSCVSRKANFILVNANYDTVFGFLNGTLLDSDGNKIQLKDFPAVAKRNRIRL